MMMSHTLPAATMKAVKGVTASLSKGQHIAAAGAMIKPNSGNGAANNSATIHSTTKRDYPMAEPLPLPPNIDQNESTRFSPQRHRDLNGSILATSALQLQQHQQHQLPYQSIDITVDQSRSVDDAHVGPYDCQGAVSLSSAMQSNVPTPFGGMNKFTHLNMPGGQFGQGIRLMASDQQQTHYYTQLRERARQDWATYDQNATVAAAAGTGAGSLNAGLKIDWHVLTTARRQHHRSVAILLLRNNLNAFGVSDLSGFGGGGQRAAFATQPPPPPPSADGKKVTTGSADEAKSEAASTATVQLSRGERLKKAVKEYGSTVIVFHVGISLLSLGTCYALVSSGLDVVAILRSIGWAESALSARLEAGGAVASTFVIAYAVHKCFAPVRISITLGATPFIVRYLRRRGILKAPPPQP